MFLMPMSAIGFGAHYAVTGGYQPAAALSFDGSSDYLTFNPGTPSTANKYTVSMWLKPSELSNDSNAFQTFFSANVDASGTPADNAEHFGFDSDGKLVHIQGNLTSGSRGVSGFKTSDGAFNDPTAWGHFVCYRSTTTSNYWWNGAALSMTQTTAMSSSSVINSSSGYDIVVGGYGSGESSFNVTTARFDGYLADVILLDGVTTTDASDFGEDSNGIWVPKDPSKISSFNTNGFWLNFSNGLDIGNDVSGNNNDFTPSSIDPSNIAADGPADSDTKEITIYPVIDPVGPWGIAQNTLSNNNLTYVAGVTDDKWNYSSIPISNTDKVYMEFLMNGNSSGSASPGYIITKFGHPGADGVYPGRQTDASDWGMYIGSGDGTVQIYHDNAQVASLINQDGGASGDVFRFARHGAKAWFGVNTAWYDGGSGAASDADVANGDKATVTNLPTDVPLWMGFNCYGSVSITWRPYSSSWTKGIPTGFGEMKSTITGTGNAPTFNPLIPQSAFAFSEGNLKAVGTTSSSHRSTLTTMAVTGGKWYYEHTAIALSGSPAEGYYVGVQPASGAGSLTEHLGDHADSFAYTDTGDKCNNNSFASYGDTFEAGDVIGVALDLDNGNIFFSKNSAWQNSATASEIAAGTDTNAAYTSLSSTTGYIPGFSVYNTGTAMINFGQKPFVSTPPTGFKAINTSNIAEPTVTDPSAYFQTETYTGNGGTNARTFDGNSDMQPDFLWIKGRSDAGESVLVDSVRGVGDGTGDNPSTKVLTPDSQAAEFEDTSSVTSFNVDGFTLGAGDSRNDTNDNTKTYIAWGLKANGTGSSDSGNSASITVTRSTADHQGFSICKGTYTSGTQSFSHGLGAKPEMVILRDLEDASQHWQVQHKDVNANMKDITTLGLNRNNAAGSSSNWWGTEPSPTLQYFTANQVTGTNDFVCYLFKRVSGLIGIGSYTGNSAVSGPAVIVDDGASGFKPAFVLIKNTQRSGNWNIYSNKTSNEYNPSGNILLADTSQNEATVGGYPLDLTANGFKVRGNNNSHNYSGEKMIYLCFAESPFGLNNRAK